MVSSYQIGDSQSLLLHLLNQTELSLSLLALCPARPHLGIENFRQLCPFDLINFYFSFTDLSRYTNTFLEILLPPFAFFFDITRSRCSLCFLSFYAFSYTSVCSLVSRLMPPNTFGSIVIVYGGNFYINLCTSVSRYCLRVAKGLFSKLS
jgi:hypothetical protein